MAFLIGGANSAAADAAYSVANSCRWNDGDEPYMHKTLVSPTSATISTISFWTKVSMNDTNVAKGIFGSRTDTNNRHNIWIAEDSTPAGALSMWGKTSGSTVFNFATTQVFRDPSAWYHVVVAIDTTQGTDTNRVKFYVNGTRVTSFATETYPDQNAVMHWAVANAVCQVGAYSVGGGIDYEYDGYLAEFVFIDGTQYAASDFGEFNEDSPTIWQPKDPSGLTFGNNGFYLDFEASGNLGNDVNGGTDLTEVNLAAADQCQDSPTNNFATLNSINMPASNQPTLSEGNTKTITSSSGDGHFGGVSTIGVSKGKWYVEAKAVFSTSTADSRNGIGFTGTEETVLDNNRWAGGGTDGVNDHEYTYESNNGEWTYDLGSGSSSTQTSGFSDSYDNGDIIGLYLDLDNNKYYAAINGSIQNSGTGLAITAAASTPLGFYFFGCSDSTGTSTTATWDWNFGNGSYAGTAVSSAVADANGYGQFEYDPSDGGSSSFDSAAKDFYALCTKNLAEFG